MTALFGEEFLSDAFNELNRQVTHTSGADFTQKLVAAKTQFLEELVGMTRDRGKGIDYRDAQAVPNLQQKLNLLVNLSAHREQHLGSVYTDDRIEFPAKGDAESGSFRFVSDQPNVLSEVLSIGNMQENYQVRPSKAQSGAYGLFFSRPGQQSWSEVYTAERQEDCLQALRKLLDILGELNTKAEGFYLVEHILLRPMGATRFAFVLESLGRRLLQTPFAFSGRSEEVKFIEQLQKRGSQEDAYEIRQEGPEAYRLIFRDEGGRIIAQSEHYLDMQSIEQALRDITRVIEGQRDTLEERVQFLEMSHGGTAFSDDPYSMQLSAVFPGWSARMQHEHIHQVIEDIIFRYTPAHLQVHLLWTSRPKCMSLSMCIDCGSRSKPSRRGAA